MRKKLLTLMALGMTVVMGSGCTDPSYLKGINGGNRQTQAQTENNNVNTEQNTVVVDEVETTEEVTEEETLPFYTVEIKPKFNGGDANEFSKWVNQRLVYPEICVQNGVSGRVTLSFTIKADGTLADVKVLRGVDPALDQEALRVVKSSPKWTPGKQRDRAVPVSYTFPVIFQLR